MNILKKTNTSNNEPKTFGAFQGVYLPSVLTILGVIMYLRMGWVVGSVGLATTILIVTISSIVTFFTALSISAIATNMKVKGGGAYFMISRTFGVEAGAAVGLSLFLAQAFGITFYIVGFSESLNDIFPLISPKMISIITLSAITILAFISADLALKAQVLIFFIIIASLVSFFMGTPLTENTASSTSIQNHASFWIVFSVFFPAVTGILTGVSMSGDLKNPNRDIPLGTIAAVITGFIVYLAIPIYLSQLAPRNILLENKMIIRDVSKIKELILLGIWGATLSSALGSILAAPRTLQALAKDRVVPSFIGWNFGSNSTPAVATVISFLIALAGITLGDLNTIAPILTMFVLATYGTLNLIAALETFIGNPSWRPSIKVPWTISLLSSLACIIFMLMINTGATIIAVIIIVFLYFITSKRSLIPRWLDIRRSILQAIAKFSIYKLSNLPANTRSWRPNIFLLSGAPTQRWHLIEFANNITQDKSFLTVSTILNKDVNQEKILSLEKSVKDFLNDRHVDALVEICAADSFLSGAIELSKSYGLGPLTPNTFIFGETEKKENFIHFAELISTLYKQKRNILVFREKEYFLPPKSKTRKITCWWGGKQNNAGFMLTIGYLLQKSKDWESSNLAIKTIVNNKEDFEHITNHLKKFLDDARIIASPEVVIEPPQQDYISTTIKENSKDSDLVFMGIRAPIDEESFEEYARYYEALLQKTSDFPTTVFALAGQDINFKDIFK